MLDVVKLRKLAIRIGRDELLKLGGGLTPKVRAIHEKQDALRSGVFDEPIGERTGVSFGAECAVPGALASFPHGRSLNDLRLL
jgi:hypothetical protein